MDNSSMFKIFVNEIIPGKTAVKYLFESDDIGHETLARAEFERVLRDWKAKAGTFFGFGDCIEVVMERGHRGKCDTLGGFWLVDEKVAHEIVNF